MRVLGHLRPHRSLVFPFVVVAAPLLWFVARAYDRGARGGLTPGETAAAIAASLLASYLAAVVAVAALGARDGDLSPPLDRLFAPTDPTLVVFTGLLGVVVGYAGIEVAFSLPAWTELAFGVPAAWPLFALLLAAFAAGNAVPALQHIAVQGAAVALGVALSAAWLFLVAGWLAPQRSR